MKLTDHRLTQLDNPALSHEERILLRCRLAAEFINSEQYELARQALGELWQGVGHRPDIESLPPLIAAEVLLQCGVLSGWLGSIQNISGAQEQAKDLIYAALRSFRQQQQQVKVAQAWMELSLCYLRLGAHEQARETLDEALNQLVETEADLRGQILLRRALCESWTGRNHDALHILERAREFMAACGDSLQGRWHAQLAKVFMRLAFTEQRAQRADYAERAVDEYTAAINHYNQAGHERGAATNAHNLAFLLYKLGRYQQAHQHLDRARRVLSRLKDTVLLAQVDQTRARVYLAEQKYREANGVIAGVIQSLEKSRESALLADALTSQGIVWARLGVYDKSMSILRRAIDVAEAASALAHAGHAALSLIEEHGARRLNPTELYNIYRRADRLLKSTPDAEVIARLRACALIVMRRLSGGRIRDKNFSLYGAMQELEAKFIEQALEEEEGSVTRAARLLGITHQSLASMLKSRHRSLLHKRTPVQRRLRSIIKKEKKQKKQSA